MFPVSLPVMPLYHAYRDPRILLPFLGPSQNGRAEFASGLILLNLDVFSHLPHNTHVYTFCLMWQTESLSFQHSVQFSCSVDCDSLWPHGLQHTRPPCPSPTARIYPNPCPLSRWCHPTISSSVIPFSSCPQSFPASGSWNESALCNRWPKYWSFSFSISPSNEHWVLISFRMDWLDLLAVQGTLKSLLPHHSSKISSLVLAFFISHIHTWPLENHSLD